MKVCGSRERMGEASAEDQGPHLGVEPPPESLICSK
jgi:hypothetical protein